MLSDSDIVKRSLLISFASRYASTCLQFISVMLLARLLTPQEIGIYTIGLAIIGLAHMVRDFGVGSYLIQEKNLSREIVSAALGLTIVLAWTMGGLIFLVAPHIAAFYNEKAVEHVIYVVCINFFIIPFGAMTPALLTRSMSFGSLFKINFFATLSSVVAGVALAYGGYGYMSMAWASVANVIVRAAMAQFYLPAKYRVWPSLRNSAPILNFGRHLMGANLANEINSSALDLFVGKALGFGELGFLSRGQGFVKIYSNVIQKAINPVVSAQFSKTYRGGRDAGTSYFYTINLVTVTGWFVLGFMGLMSLQLIRLLYGEQWDSAAPVASILCLGGCLGIPNGLARALLVSTGKPKPHFRLTVVFVILRIALIAIFVDRGLIFLAWSFIFLGAFNVLATHIVVFISFGFNPWQFAKIIVKNLLITVGALVLPIFWLLEPSGLEMPMLLRLVLTGLISCMSWLAIVYIAKHPVSKEITLFVNRLKDAIQNRALS